MKFSSTIQLNIVLYQNNLISGITLNTTQSDVGRENGDKNESERNGEVTRGEPH